MRSLFIALLVSSACVSAGQSADSLARIIRKCDSLLFDVGYNSCDITQFERLVSEDFEFYHDEAGITSSKTAFIASVRDGLCKLNYTPRRELLKGSMEVFPLKKDGMLYGAIETGSHRFFAIQKGRPERLTSTARFTHVWLLEHGTWRLRRALSYDHKSPDQN